MKPHTQAVREAQAWERIRTEAKRLAAEMGSDAQGLDATHRDVSLQQLFRVEALADFLAGVHAAPSAPAAPEPKSEPKSETKPDPGNTTEVQRERTK